MMQFVILTRRSFQQYFRRKHIILMNFIVTIILAVFVSLGIWHNIGTDQASITTRIPSLFFACVTQGIVASLQCISSFPTERAIMLRERAAGSYFVSSYFMAKTVVDILTNSWSPMIFSAIVYPTIGYQPGAHKFFVYLGFMVMDSVAALSLATVGACVRFTLYDSVCFLVEEIV
jgi:ATP-binding cassette subfamily G (WHITE) protein 2